MTGQQLRDARRKAGLSMAEAARLTGTPYATWQGWEAEGTKNARRPPPIVFAWLELYAKLHGRQSISQRTDGRHRIAQSIRLLEQNHEGGG